MRAFASPLMIMLQVFVHDPVTAWRLHSRRRLRKPTEKDNEAGEDAEEGKIHRKAMGVMHRVQAKLAGTEFGRRTMSIDEQLERVIAQARDNSNLAQMWMGFCPFW